MKLQRDKSGQALMEFALVLPMLCIFFMGVVDYGRAIYASEVITNLAGEGSSIASRNPQQTLALTLQSAANTVMTDADLNMTTYGCAIVSSVTNGQQAGTYTITGQEQPSDPSCTISVTSKYGGSGSSPTNLPTGVQQALTNGQAGSTIYITEVFYNYHYITDVGGFLHGTGVLPSQLYAAAYY
jgi:Flp pilus assembly protein TadG